MIRRVDIAVAVYDEVNGTHYHYLDMHPTQAVTLNFGSGILGGVSEIKASGSLTIKLPRTVRNDRLFDLAMRPQYESLRPYGTIPCRMEIDGITLVRAAHLTLLNCSDQYEAAVVFGLMQNYSEWLANAPSLRDLPDGGESILWNWRAAFYGITIPPGSPHDIIDYPPVWHGGGFTIGTYTPSNGVTTLMHYGVYRPGFTRDDETVDLANVHPFVTVREIWQRLINDGGLDFVLPADVLQDMDNLALVLTDPSGNTPSGTPSLQGITFNGGLVNFSLQQTGSLVYFCPRFSEAGYVEEPYPYGRLIALSNGNGQVRIGMTLVLSGNAVRTFMTKLHNDTSMMRFFIGEDYIEPIYDYNNKTLTYTGNVTLAGSDNDGENIGMMFFELPTALVSYNEINDFCRNVTVSTHSMSYTYYTGSVTYPNTANYQFALFPNLPNMKQLDFVKFVCDLYGLFPVQTIDSNTINFIPYEQLRLNTTAAVDWSAKLIDTGDDAPKKTQFHLNDYARRNWLEWKEDKEDYVDDNIRRYAIAVNDLTLEKEKTIIALPFAASNGDTIDQYDIVTDENGVKSADFKKCEYRIMRVTMWEGVGGADHTSLEFLNLAAPVIAATRYSYYQAVLQQPRIITEDIRLTELDLRGADFSIPVYLSKYGRYYAVMSVQYRSDKDYCEVELLQL